MASQQQLLVDLDVYLKSGLHIGTKYKTKYMEPFIYKIRPDGLSVLNIEAIDKRIALVTKFLSRFKPEEILIVGKRENGWAALRLFGDMTGIRCFAGRYSPGMLTNPSLEDFVETKVLLVADPWPDKDAVRDAMSVGVTVIALCDTNNTSNYLDLVIPSNNKGKKSLGLFYWILAREYMKNRGLINDESEMKYKLDAFMAD